MSKYWPMIGCFRRIRQSGSISAVLPRSSYPMFLTLVDGNPYDGSLYALRPIIPSNHHTRTLYYIHIITLWTKLTSLNNYIGEITNWHHYKHANFDGIHVVISVPGGRPKLYCDVQTIVISTVGSSPVSPLKPTETNGNWSTINLMFHRYLPCLLVPLSLRFLFTEILTCFDGATHQAHSNADGAPSIYPY